MTALDGMANIVNMLRAQRTELLGKLAAVDTALAALSSAGSDVGEAQNRTQDPTPDTRAATTADVTSGVVVPTLVKPKRVLSESHKQALVVSGRRARGAKEATKGLAREMPEASFVPAIGRRGESQPPRLVKPRIRNRTD